MIYFLLRPLTRLAFLAFYRKIHLTGTELIPRDKPLILTANHPTAFIEPCFLACFSPRVLHFMTRGDVFANRWISWLLQQVHLIPIFRFHDGFSALRRNDTSFATARKVLGRGGAILIMAEGRMAHEKRLRPLQKGAARIGFGAMEEFDLSDVMIQPVGINYTYADQARSTMMVDFAPAFSLREYWDSYQTTPQEALQMVTERIRVELAERVVHIDRIEDEPLAELILQMLRVHQPAVWPIVMHDRAPLLAEARAMDQLGRIDEESREELYPKASAYDQLRKAAGIQDETVQLAPTWNTGQVGLMMVMRICRGLAFILQAPPILFGRWITRRTVRIIEFRSSVLLGATMFAWAIWVGLITVIVGAITGVAGGLCTIVLYLLSAIGYTLSGQVIKHLDEARKWSSLSEDQRSEVKERRKIWWDAWEEAAGAFR